MIINEKQFDCFAVFRSSTNFEHIFRPRLHISVHITRFDHCM